MDPCGVLRILLLPAALLAWPTKVPLAVLLHPEDDPLQLAVFRYAVRHINADKELLPGSELLSVVVNVSQSDSFSVGRRVCSVTQNGVAAIFGPRDPSTTGIVQSVCENLEVPNMETYAEVPEYPARCLINVHPSQQALSQAMADVIKNFLHWQGFTIIYETDNGLLRLQEVLKAHGPSDPPVVVRQLLPGHDQRQLLKEIKASGETHVLLDCATERIVDILKQAIEIRMMDEYSSYFITSLDTHTLNLPHFVSEHTNITALRLVDPESSTVKSVVKFWSDWEEHYRRHLSITPEMVRTEMALMHDAVFLFARALHKLYLPREQFGVKSLRCDGAEKWSHGFALSNYMKLMAMDGMTGNIRFDEFGHRSHVRLDVVEYFGGMFKKVGWWETGLGAIRTQSESEKQAEIEKSLQTKKFIVLSKTSEPYLMKRVLDEPLEGNARYEGYSMDLITEIAKRLGFEFEFRLVPSNNHSEIVKELKARRGDLGICDLTITHQREQEIDFTMPFMNLGISILYRKPVKPEPRLFAFLDPFSIDVWIYVATAYLGVSILLFVLARMSPGEWNNPHPCNPNPEELENSFNLLNCLWFSIGSLMGQGCDILPKISPEEWTSPHPCKSEPSGGCLKTKLTMSNCIWHNCGSIMQQGSDIAPQAVSTRIVGSMWGFFTLIMISSYTANLAAFLTLNRMESSISSAEDLAKQYKIKYGTMEGGSTASFFKNSNDTIYKRIYTVMSQTRPSVFVQSNNEGMERVKKGKGLYAFFMESTTIEYNVERNCDLQQVGRLLDSKGYGIGLPLNSPYRTVVSGALLWLQERGVLEKLKEKWWKVQDGISCSKLEAVSAKGSSNELGLDNVGGVFVVLITGTLAAFLVAVLELLWNCRKIAVEEKVSPCRALVSELKFAMNCSGANKPVRKKEEEEEEDEDEDTMPAGVTAGSFAQMGFEKFKDKE